MPNADYELPYEGAKKRILVDDVDNKDFLAALEKVHQTRNDVMHFDPDGIDTKAIVTLRNIATYLTAII